jgi:hypothetical protein
MLIVESKRAGGIDTILQQHKGRRKRTMDGNTDGNMTLTGSGRNGDLLACKVFLDVELIATNGQRIAANRAILLAHSKVFEILLFGKFAESSSSSVCASGL